MSKAPLLYKTYAEIPVLTKEYMEVVANVKDITQIPLDDINSYLQGLTAYHKQVLEEYGDGWVL